MVAEEESTVGRPLCSVIFSDAWEGEEARPVLDDGAARVPGPLSLSGGVFDLCDPFCWSSGCLRPPPLPPTAEAAEAVDKSINVEKRRTRRRLMTAKRPVGVVSS